MSFQQARPASPNSQRIRSLADMLNGLQGTINDVSARRTAQQSSLECQVKGLEERLSRMQVAEETKFKLAQEQIGKLIEGVETERLGREILEERRAKEVKLLESSFQLDLNGIRSARRDGEAELDRAMNEFAHGVREEVGREAAARGEALEDHLSTVGGEVRRLFEAVENEKESRIEKGGKLEEAIEDELSKVRESLDEERRIREHQEGTTMKNLQELCLTITAELNAEREERQRVEDQLLHLLEETCNRVEAMFAPLVSEYPGLSLQMEREAIRDVSRGRARNAMQQQKQHNLMSSVQGGASGIAPQDSRQIAAPPPSSGPTQPFGYPGTGRADHYTAVGQQSAQGGAPAAGAVQLQQQEGGYFQPSPSGGYSVSVTAQVRSPGQAQVRPPPGDSRQAPHLGGGY
uniref:Uncharacterized protein n=1 Tax=Chromera velia CCMP2878 TaxID=1169474 RepID=A0A0G4FPS7_9ALVE|mmetsp:Transcript_20165/g.40462  ORF Transcript_20165/g.40462 Transcript_20165/m.40462 type:complete len:406 (+) Transcript_20165:313-1530(+)|eukprot:Cvel_3613.t1-p1 / transcript=Cvel_3613.t1 / gene=Cvel_3613 / organism=Chromera_velia_CCMP2878 / gene_product=Uncharacterized protein MAL7P1.13, putative / transcript_product=Uncharacterized protein MAL7P1.13, putative / location=Cvel_scaffold148:62297-67081(-) / protein_length=405 / sequence_SO=supercontig / SO=protein_coding / is_pseudo=false